MMVAHAIAVPLEEGAVQSCSRLVGRNRKVRAKDELGEKVELELERRRVRIGLGQGRKIFARHAAKGVAPSARSGLDRRGEAVVGHDVQRTVGHHLDALVQVLRRNGDASTLFDIDARCRAAHGQVEIGRRDAKLGRSIDAEEHVRQSWHRALLVGDTLATPDESQKLFFRNGNVHASPRPSALRWIDPTIVGSSFS